MEKYKVTTELYHEYMIYKNELLQFISTEIFTSLKKYIDTGDLIFTGSIVHDRLGIIKKEYIGDIDISINDEIGDEIRKALVKCLNQIDMTKYKDQFFNYFRDKILENNKHLEFNDILAIDIFRNKHPQNVEYELELYPNVYTKCFKHEWYLKQYYDSLMKISKLKDFEKRDKQIIKFINIFETYLKFIDINDFHDKDFLKKLQYIVNYYKSNQNNLNFL